MNRSIRSIFCCALTLAAFAAFATSASATDLCVGAGTTCDQTFAFTEAGFDEAVDAYYASDNGTDNIYIAPGTIDFSDSLEVEVDGPLDGELRIRGAGSGKTKLVFNDVAGNAVNLGYNGSDSEISGLSIESIGGTAGNRVGLRLYGGNAEDVYVYMLAGTNNKAFSLGETMRCIACRAKVSGASSAGFHVEADSSAYIEEGKAEVYDADSTVHTRGVSLEADDSEAELSRTLLKNFNRGVFTNGGWVKLQDSIINLGDQDDAFGLQLDISNPLNENFRAATDGVTIYGTGDNQLGAYLYSSADGPNSIEVDIVNTLIWLPGSGTNELYCERLDGATAAINYMVGYSIAPDSVQDVDCPIAQNNMRTGTATFVDEAGGDLRPAPGSAVIDAGWFDTDYRPFDFYGATRFADGIDLEGAGDIDVGAGEYQNYAPNKPEVSATPTTVTAGAPVIFSATGSDPNNQPVTFSWEFSEGGSASGASVSRIYTTPGTYKAKAIASDGTLTKASAWLEITVLPAPPAPSIVLSKPTAKFKYGKKKPKPFAIGAATSKPRIPVTTNFAGEVTLTLAKIKGGWTSGTKCVSKKPRKGKPKRCDLPLKGSQKLTLPSGASFLTFGGKWGRSALPTGAYRLTVSALGARHETALNAVRNLKG